MKMIKKILIINPFGIGDVLFSTPLVSAVKKEFRGCYISYICNIRTEEMLTTNPDIDEVFVFERDEYRELWKKSRLECVRKFFRFWREIQKKRFDIAIDLSLGREYAFFCWLVGIKERRGFDYKGRGCFLTRKILFEGFNDKPVSEYYLELVSLRSDSLKTVLIPTYGDKGYIDDFFKKSDIRKEDVLVGIAPGGGAAFGKVKAYYKRWAPERFRELVKKISGLGVRPVILWGPGEEDIVKLIQDEVDNKVLLAPRTSIKEMAVLMKRCKLVICNDGGMLHIATSQDTPTISIFGPTDDKVYGSYPPSEKHAVIKSDADCRPCYRRFKLPECSTKRCMEDISVETIFNAIRRKL